MKIEIKAMKNGRSSGSGRIGVSKCAGEYLNKYLW